MYKAFLLPKYSFNFTVAVDFPAHVPLPGGEIATNSAQGSKLIVDFTTVETMLVGFWRYLDDYFGFRSFLQKAGGDEYSFTKHGEIFMSVLVVIKL